MEKVDYEVWRWTDNDRHRLINAEWVATKRARAAEAKLKNAEEEIARLNALIASFRGL